MEISMKATVIQPVMLFLMLATAAHAAGQERLELPVVLNLDALNPVHAGAMPWFSRNEVSFDRHNRPYIRSRSDHSDATGFIHTLRDGRWIRKDFTEAVREAYPGFQHYYQAGGWTGSRIVFDGDDHLYTLVQARLDDGSTRTLLLFSRDHGDSFEVCELPRLGGARLQHASGARPLPRPPLIGFIQRHRDHPSRWARYHNMWVVQPHKTEVGMNLGEPVHVTDRSLSNSLHSGEPSFAVAFEDRTIFTWQEITEEEDAYGSPVFVATFYPERNELGERHQVAVSAPPNDGHNAPGLAVDSEEYAHLMTGAHGMNFYYSRAMAPGTADEGWSEPQRMLHTGWLTIPGGQSIYGHQFPGGVQLGRQTYAAFACGPDDTLHLVFRQWRQGEEQHFDGHYYGALSYQQKPRDGEWSEALVLIVPPVPRYSIYYHKLSIDRLGRLFLSYNHYSHQQVDGEIVTLYDQALGRYQHRAVIMSDDGGKTWQPATTEAFAAGISPEKREDAQLSPVRLEGRVTDAQRRAVEGAAVSIGLYESFKQPEENDWDPALFTPLWHQETDANGRFEFDGILAAEIGIVVKHPDHITVARPIVFESDETVREITLTIDPLQ
jgi:hypothetical protein